MATGPHDAPEPSRVAATDATGTRRLRALRDDLDRVLLKALAFDPGQRYGTADELIDDLRRWLAGRPLLATPPKRGYRLRKFVSRHRVGVAAAAVFVVTLAAGVAGTLWQARQARLQAVHATAMKDFVLDLFAAANPDFTEGQDPPASQLLKSGASRVRGEFAARPLVLAEMLGMIGRAQLERGSLVDAESSLDQAIEAFARNAVPTAKWVVAVADRGMLAYERGDPAEALRRLQEAERIGLAAGLASTDAERIHLLVRMAEMQVELDRSAIAEQLARSALQRIDLAGAREAPIRPDALSYWRPACNTRVVAKRRLPFCSRRRTRSSASRRTIRRWR